MKTYMEAFGKLIHQTIPPPKKPHMSHENQWLEDHWKMYHFPMEMVPF